MNATVSLPAAVAVSLLAHFLVLWPAPVSQSGAGGSGVLTAVLTMPAPVALLELPTSPAVRARQAPVAVYEPRTLPLPARVSRVASSVHPPRTVAEVVMPVLSVESANHGATDATSVDGLRSYRLALASQARRLKSYAPQAVASDWQGTAEIRLDVGAEGRPPEARVQRSSGRDQLDQAALAIISAAAEYAALPEPLRGKHFSVMLPVVFDAGQP